MRVVFEMSERDDGTVVVSCPQMPIFHVVAQDERVWQTVFEIAAQYVALNGEEAILPVENGRS